MTKTLIKNGHLIDPAQDVDGNFDILIDQNKIQQIEPTGNINDPQAKTIDAKGLIVSPGFIELHCHLRDPGFEYKETIQSGTASAVSGGFTRVCCMANTNPVNDNASVTDYINKRAAESGYCHV
ncbi:dihydroorotase, partial [bacterium K02(2017)]